MKGRGWDSTDFPKCKQRVSSQIKKLNFETDPIVWLQLKWSIFFLQHLPWIFYVNSFKNYLNNGKHRREWNAKNKNGHFGRFLQLALLSSMKRDFTRNKIGVNTKNRTPIFDFWPTYKLNFRSYHLEPSVYHLYISKNK